MTHISVDKALSKAKSHFKNGEIKEARKFCLLVLNVFPKNTRAQNLLTSLEVSKVPQKIKADLVAYYNSSDFKMVIDISKKFIEQNPGDCFVWNICGLANLNLGRINEALENLKIAVSLNKTNYEYFNNLGVASEKLKDWESSITFYKKALELQPNYFQAYYNMGNVFLASGQLEQAIIAFKKVIAIEPNYVEAYNNLANILQEQGKLENAITIYKKAIVINPNLSNIYNNLGNALQKLFKFNDSIEFYKKALALNPNFYQSLNNLGNSFKHKGMIASAKEMYQKALSVKPDYVEAHNNLGVLFQEQGNFEEAIVSYKKAIFYNSNFCEALNNLGIIYSIKGCFKESINFFEKALLINPNYESARLQKLHQLSHICDWKEIRKDYQLIQDLGIKKQSVSPWLILSLDDNPYRHLVRSQKYSKSKFNQNSKKFDIKSIKSERIIRLGYFGADFYNHATMYLMSRIFSLHNRKKFEVYVYSYGNNKNDIMRQKLISNVDVFDDVSQMSDRDIAYLARQDKIDIAIDLKGYTQNTRSGIFSYRAAPVQINYLGYPGTMGTSFIDYIIADNIIVPEMFRECYSEKIIFMPYSYQPNDNKRKISTKQITRLEMGLPEDSFVFCSFNNLYKITSQEFDIWMRIMKKIEGSVLWLLKSNKWGEENLKKEAQNRGVEPSRLIFAEKISQEEHLARHKLADLFIDTFNVNAHTTASDALWAGLPVVTKLGKSFASRVAGSLLNAIDLPELITENKKDYENSIFRLATNRHKLMKIREKLSINRMSKPLFDSKQYTQHLESGYEQAYINHISGLKPKTIYIKN